MSKMENWIYPRQHRLKEKKSRLRKSYPLFMRVFYYVLLLNKQADRGESLCRNEGRIALALLEVCPTITENKLK